MSALATSPFVDGYVFLEGPRWHEGRLWVSDIWAHKVYCIEEDGRAEIAAEVPERPSGLGFLPDGTPLIVSMQDRRVYRLDNGVLELHADIGNVVNADINDMVVDDQGRAYVGDMGYDLFGGGPSAPGGITLIEADGSYRTVATGLDFPNGMVITDGGDTLVVAESFGERLRAFDRAANGELSNPRVYATLEGLVPDGICLDVDGNIWVAGAMGGAFVKVSPAGEVVAHIDVGPDAAIACQLGGSDGRTLHCLVYAGGIEELSSGKPGARIETVRVDSAAAGSP